VLEPIAEHMRGAQKLIQNSTTLAGKFWKPSDAPGYPIAIIRIVLGIWFLIDGIRYFNLGSEWNSSVVGFLQGSVDNENVWPFYHSFTETFLLANVDFVAAFVLFSFVFVGIGLTLGVLTRFFALFGIFLTLNFVLARGFGLLGAHVDAWFLIAELALLFSTAGSTFGLDGWLSKRWPRARFLMGVP